MKIEAIMNTHIRRVPGQRINNYPLVLIESIERKHHCGTTLKSARIPVSEADRPMIVAWESVDYCPKCEDVPESAFFAPNGAIVVS